jgi:cytochrome P450
MVAISDLFKREDQKPMRDTPDVLDIDWPETLGPYDPQSHLIQANPFPYFKFMRENAPVVKARTPQGELWFISLFSDVEKALRDHKRFSSAVVELDKFRVITLMDAPRHTQMRTLVAAAFTPKTVAAFDQNLQSLFNQYFVPILERGEGDICTEFSEQMTMGTICAFLGFPLTDFERLRDLAIRTTFFQGRVARHAPGCKGDEEGFLELLEILREKLHEARRSKNGTIIAKFAEQIDQGLITEDDALQFCAFLFLAGFDTTALLISNGFLTLAEQPHLLERLRKNPQEVGRFVEELARFRAAPQKLARRTTEEIEVAGFRIPANAQVKLLPGSANRDEAKFPNGETFDMDRDPTGHLGFGYGVHTCLGIWLARSEARTVYSSVANLVSHIEIVPEIPIVPYSGGTLQFTGPASMHVRLTPQRQTAIA